MASYKASARSLDQGVGSVLNALDEHDLADDTLVILTTDHGLAFPGAKATLYDRGIGVLLIMRGPGGFHGGRVSERARLPGRPVPDDLRARRHRAAGAAAGPLAAAGAAPRGEEVNDAIFAELTYHAAYEPHARGAHGALEVHPPLRRPPAARAPQRGRQPDQGPAARRRAGATSSCRARSSTTSRFDPVEAHNLSRAALRASRRRAARAPGGLDARDRRPAARRPCRAAPEGAELNGPDQISPGRAGQRARAGPRGVRALSGYFTPWMNSTSLLDVLGLVLEVEAVDARGHQAGVEALHDLGVRVGDRALQVGGVRLDGLAARERDGRAGEALERRPRAVVAVERVAARAGVLAVELARRSRPRRCSPSRRPSRRRRRRRRAGARTARRRRGFVGPASAPGV